MKKRTLTLIFMLIWLSACTGKPTPSSQPTQVVPTTPPPTAPAPTQLPTSAPTPTPAPTAVTDTGQPVILLSIHMTSVDEGWGVGVVAEGTLQRILRTADGGQTWKDVTPPDQAAKKGNTDVAVLPAYSGINDAWAIYFSPMPAAASEAVYVWHTADRGQTWQAGSPLITENLTAEFFIPGELGFSDANNGWLLAHVGAGMSHDYVALYKTDDGGMSWYVVVDPSSTGDTSLPMVCSKDGLTFRDAETGWASGNCNGVMDETFLYQTSDGGVNWSLVNLPEPPGQPNLLTAQENVCGTLAPIWMDSQNGALAVDCRGADGMITRWIYTSADGGATWQPQPRRAARWSATDVTFTRSGDNYVLQSVHQSETDGLLFAPLFNDPASPPVLELASSQSGLDFVDALHGWAVASLEDGRAGLLRTTDAGRAWQQLQPVLLP